MKLRQKLAVVLAASMVATAVPVITMADTSNSSHCDVYVRDGVTMGYKEDGEAVLNPGEDQVTATLYSISSSTSGKYADRYITNLELYPKDNYKMQGDNCETFFVELTDGEFNWAAYAIAMLNVRDNTLLDEDGNPVVETLVDHMRDIAADINVELDNVETTPKAFKNITDLGVATNKYYVKDGVIYTADGDKVGKAEDIVKNNISLVYSNDKGGHLTFKLLDDKHMRIDIYGDWYTSSKQENATSLYVPILAKAKSTQVKIKVDGADSFVTSGTYTVGSDSASGKEATITADDAAKPISYEGGEISKLIVTEEVLNAVANSENRELKLELPSNCDFEFKTTGIKAVGKRAFSGKEQEDLPATWGVSGRNNVRDRQILVIQLPDWEDETARGVIELEGIKIQPIDDFGKLGDLTIKASAVKDDDFLAETSLTVGKVVEYDVTLTCAEPAKIKAGRSAIVNDYRAEVVLAEAVRDSLITGRDVKFTLENGYIVGPADIFNWSAEVKRYFYDTVPVAGTLTQEDRIEAQLNEVYALLSQLRDDDNNSLAGYSPKSAAYKKAALDTIKHLVEEEDIKFSEDADGINKNPEAIKDVQINNKGQVIGITIDGDLLETASTDNDKRIDVEQRDDLKMKFPVATSLQSEGEVTLVASGRALAELGQEDKLSCKVADITSPIKVDMTAAELKVGLQTQSAGSLVINETDKGMIEKGTIIVDANPDEEYGIKFQTVPTVDATGLKVSDVALSNDKRYLYIEVQQTSTEAGKIAISNMQFTTDRTVPEGKFPVRFYGDALTDEDVKTYDAVLWDKYVVDDFIKITTPNTEDIKNGALKAVTSTFTIGSSNYTVDGKEYQMDAPAYVKDGRTMVPLRYIAYAFGLEPGNVLFGDSTATIVAGEKIVQVKLGSNIMLVNGSPIVMDTTAELKDGRTFVPMSYIAAALGITPTWDAASKTATFSNVASK